jgi:ABC-2 type transport system permease protein
MTAVATTLPTPVTDVALSLRDGWTVVRRNLAQMRHAPAEIVGELVFPALMVIIFGYIFGSAIAVPGGGNYREYLIPGLFSMTAVTGIVVTMNKVAADNGQGVMDRFRSMPMARWAVPFGQTGADLLMSLPKVAIMAGIGFVTGWRVHHGLGHALVAFGLILLMTYALNWIGVLLGLSFENESTADKWTPMIFPVTMVSNSFVPTHGMPTWLRTIADWNPASALTQACRTLFGNPSVVAGHAWPMQHPVPAVLIWSAIILIATVPLATHRYRIAGR